MIKSIVFIGAGNLATQTALAMFEKGINIEQVFSNTLESARLLAKKVNAQFTCKLNEVITSADLYIIATKDSVIQEVLMNLQLPDDRFIVHTAGSVSIDLLKGYCKNYGVFYPLQTFTKSKKVDFTNIPICIEANHPVNFLKLQELAYKLSRNVYQINSEERRTLHLAAVFACNFVNHMYAVGEQLLKDEKLDFDLLRPLIKETAEKAMHIKPYDAQTGPAVRYDKNIIQQHLDNLSDKPEIQKLYSFVTESIFQLHQKHDNDI